MISPHTGFTPNSLGTFVRTLKATASFISMFWVNANDRVKLSAENPEVEIGIANWFGETICDEVTNPLVNPK